jgi:hypothetical protein
MKKLILVLTILMLVTVQSYASGKPKCSAIKPEYKSYQKSNRTRVGECGSFGKLKMPKENNKRFHNYR